VNKLIDGLFEHKILVRVLSVLTAILLWFIVLDNNNPLTTRSISVPITGNPEVLEDNNLQVIGTGAPLTVSLSIRGRRNKVSDVTSNDFRVVLDYDQVKTSGNVTLDIGEPEFLGESNIRVLSMNPVQVNLRLERITGIEFPVEVRWEGSLPDGFRAANIRVEPSTVRFEDKESLVNRIENAVVVLDATALDKTSNLNRRVLVLDADGNSVSQFDGKNTVSVSFDLIRTLPVTTRVIGTPAEDWFVTSWRTNPQDVQVLGKYESLTSLTGVQAADIVLDGKEGSFEADLTLTVPEGFSLYGTKPQVSAQVEMEKLVTGEYEIPVERIMVSGIDSTTQELRFLTETFRIVLKGKAQEFENVDMLQINILLDATPLLEGETDAPLRVTVPTGFSLVGEPRVGVNLLTLPEVDIPAGQDPGNGEENPAGDDGVQPG
jgi:YbbR domain-containing protein